MSYFGNKQYGIAYNKQYRSKGKSSTPGTVQIYKTPSYTPNDINVKLRKVFAFQYIPTRTVQMARSYRTDPIFQIRGNGITDWILFQRGTSADTLRDPAMQNANDRYPGYASNNYNVTLLNDTAPANVPAESAPGSNYWCGPRPLAYGEKALIGNPGANVIEWSKAPMQEEYEKHYSKYVVHGCKVRIVACVCSPANGYSKDGTMINQDPCVQLFMRPYYNNQQQQVAPSNSVVSAGGPWPNPVWGTNPIVLSTAAAPVEQRAIDNLTSYQNFAVNFTDAYNLRKERIAGNSYHQYLNFRETTRLMLIDVNDVTDRKGAPTTAGPNQAVGGEHYYAQSTTVPVSDVGKPKYLKFYASTKKIQGENIVEEADKAATGADPKDSWFIQFAAMLQGNTDTNNGDPARCRWLSSSKIRFEVEVIHYVTFTGPNLVTN